MRFPWIFLDHADGGGGTPTGAVEPGIKGEPGSREELLGEFAQVVKTIQDGTGNQEKLIDALGEVTKAIKTWDAKATSKMEFPAGAETKRLAKTGGFKALMDLPNPEDGRVKELQKLNDDLLIVNAVCSADKSGNYGGIKSLGMFTEFTEVKDDFAKAMDTATAGQGLEWVPSTLSGDLQSIIDINLQVAGLHNSYNMPAPEHKLPIKLTHATGYKAAQTTDADSPAKIPKSTVGTDDVTFTAVKVAGRVVWTGEQDQDSVVPMLPMLRTEIPIAVARAIETGTINGQPAGTIDSGDVPGATDARALWDGYRKYAETNSAVKYDMAADFDIEGFTTLRKKLSKTGLVPAQLAWVVSASAYFQMLTLKDTNNNPVVVPAYAYGPMATAISGELGRLQGIPVIPSEFVREDLNATGIYDGITETKTAVLLVHRDSWLYGTRKELTVEASPEPYFESGDLVIRGIARMDFNPLFPYANQRACSLGYNIAS
jgi:HK97 family phage major capsid protein